MAGQIICCCPKGPCTAVAGVWSATFSAYQNLFRGIVQVRGWFDCLAPGGDGYLYARISGSGAAPTVSLRWWQQKYHAWTSSGVADTPPCPVSHADVPAYPDPGGSPWSVPWWGDNPIDPATYPQAFSPNSPSPWQPMLLYDLDPTVRQNATTGAWELCISRLFDGLLAIVPPGTGNYPLIPFHTGPTSNNCYTTGADGRAIIHSVFACMPTAQWLESSSLTILDSVPGTPAEWDAAITASAAFVFTLGNVADPRWTDPSETCDCDTCIEPWPPPPPPPPPPDSGSCTCKVGECCYSQDSWGHASVNVTTFNGNIPPGLYSGNNLPYVECGTWQAPLPTADASTVGTVFDAFTVVYTGTQFTVTMRRYVGYSGNGGTIYGWASTGTVTKTTTAANCDAGTGIDVSAGVFNNTCRPDGAGGCEPT